ncbi:hypothetical protein TNCV_195481 [Trichonephila clavipes]|uniref:Uncharacterized protein n=1 Tax=Trichonephila clavipes TaxID=2585209 RepID=A0A8X6WIL7_TRICX|nr:hypothetical protein TNCV_195481 [Trichonephila clavipes]
MNEDRTFKKVFNAQPIGTRRKGRPNLRWIDGLEKRYPSFENLILENTGRKKAGLEKASREGQGPPWAVVPLRKISKDVNDYVEVVLKNLKNFTQLRVVRFAAWQGF